MERAVYWAQDRKGGRTLKSSRHGDVEQTPRSTGDESARMEALLIAHERSERANQTTATTSKAWEGWGKKQGAQGMADRPTDRLCGQSTAGGETTAACRQPTSRPSADVVAKTLGLSGPNVSPGRAMRRIYFCEARLPFCASADRFVRY